MEELSREEENERIAILKRFRQLLVLQRDRFRTYLESLDYQKELIEHGNIEDFSEHVKLEEKIAGDILALQKVIEPMQVLYEFSWREKEPAEMPQIKTALENLRIDAKKRWDRNKELLQERMLRISNEIKNMRSNPFSKRQSPYAATPAPSIIDITG
ncbi:MAG: flagellar biosynthesis protein FlgN [Spirochaetaceae bacterium]|jgi:hypothetical protein|nr:flagellar biosynthesis protein FlgN [Spirochaetaceae bacterium]